MIQTFELPISWQPLKRPAVYARVHAWWLNALQSREKIGLARVQTTKQATQPVALAAWEISDYTKLKSPTEQSTRNRQAGSGFCYRVSLYWRFALPVFLPVTANLLDEDKNRGEYRIVELNCCCYHTIRYGVQTEKCTRTYFVTVIAGQCRTNPWPAVSDWTWCRNADAGLKKLIACKIADAGLNFLRHSRIYIWFFNIIKQ